MQTTWGAQPDTLPDGMFKAVRFPILARLDQRLDYRIIDSAGFGSRNLPLTIRAQFTASYGHQGAEVSGALHEVTMDPETGILSGRGFLLDDEAGRRHALLIKTQAMRTNSIDLADVEGRWEFDVNTGEETLRFTKANLAATTGVATPAVADAHAVIDDEIKAALIGDDPMEELVASYSGFRAEILLAPAEITAGVDVVPFDTFYRPEADVPTKIIVDEAGNVFGHLGVWGACHDGIEGQCVTIPRPTDGYASFNKPGVLTEKGIVGTGPIFTYGGHKPIRGKKAEDAYGGIENTWCDVRLSEGKFGPWISGRVRPGTPDEVVYAARASRISGHWLAGKLKAIVSVNAEGFEVPGTDVFAAPFSFRIRDGEVAELVASFPTCLQVAEPVVEEAQGSTPTEDCSADDDLLLALLLSDD